MHNVHFIGAGGIGVNAAAKLFIYAGKSVSGCDIRSNGFTKQLEEKGAHIYKGHSPQHINESLDMVVYSSAVNKNNQELREAEKRSIPVMRRAQALAYITGDKDTISVTGTHGKTTTSFITAYILRQAGIDAGFAIGGEPLWAYGNAVSGKSRLFVAETDESDGSHLYIKPHIAVITNIDRDHTDFYTDRKSIVSSMKVFAAQTDKNGAVVYGKDIPEYKEIIETAKAECISCGWAEDSDVYVSRIELNGKGSFFTLHKNKSAAGRIYLNIPGRHNILNAMYAAAVCMHIGIPFNIISRALGRLPAIKRRMETIYERGDITIIDDYAHHPAEVGAVIGAVKRKTGGRLIGIFQPHRYTRTKALKKEFGKCFTGLDKLVLTDIYSAGEGPIRGITGRTIYNEIVSPPAVYIESKDDIPGYLAGEIRKNDILLFMGAGDITETAHCMKIQEPVYG